MIAARQLIFAFVVLLGQPSRAIAQSAPVDTLATPRRVVIPECSPAMDMYRSEISDLSYHAGWGMFIGGMAGVVFGFIERRGPLRGVTILADGFAGGAVGLVVGSGVYLVRRLRGHTPPLRARCGQLPPNEQLKLPAAPSSISRSPSPIPMTPPPMSASCSYEEGK
jgi:hypothetical protein